MLVERHYLLILRIGAGHEERVMVTAGRIAGTILADTVLVNASGMHPTDNRIGKRASHVGE